MQKTTSSKDKNDEDESDSDKSSLPKFNITSTKMSSIAMKPITSSNDKDESTDTKNEQMVEKQKLSNKADEETKRCHPSEIMTIATSEIMTVDIENSLWNNQLELPDPCLDEADVQPAWEDSLNEIAFTHTLPIKAILSDPKEFKITVHRGHVLKELIELFKCNPDVNFETDIITSQIVLPNGDIEQAYDSGGVMKDMLTEFWGDFYEQCTMGSILKIPCLRHDFEAQDWKAVAKILAMGWILQKNLPIRLAPSFLNSCLFGMTLSTDILREEFLQFVTPGDGKILTDALKDIDRVDKDDLLEVLSIHECTVKTTKDNIASVIDQIAHKELVQEPSFIRECFF